MKMRPDSVLGTKRRSIWTAVFCAAVIVMSAVMSSSAFAAPNSTQQYIGKAKAKSIALEHAGITEEKATFIKTHLDYDGGFVVYDVEFFSGNTEYDYEIDALDGKIREHDREIEYYSIPAANEGGASPQSGQQAAPNKTNAGQYIGEAKAKSIALEHAGITEEKVTFIKTHLDHDDGFVVYDVEFYSGNTEYDYEIDAIDGSIREHDREIEYYSIPAANKGGASPQSGQQAAPKNNAGQYIGEAKAKSIALSAAKLTEAQVSQMRVNLDSDDGKMVYEVDFRSGWTEYEYEIDAVSGKILKSDVDYDD